MIAAPELCPSKLIMDKHTKLESLRRETKIATKRTKDDVNFALKLYKMLSCAFEESFEDIISWEANGRSFAVRDTDKFAKEILPRFFSISRMYVFIRRLRNHGFTQASQSEAQTYQHRLFIRGKPNLVARISEQVEKKVSPLPPPPVIVTKGPEKTIAMLEEQSVVTSSSASHQSKSNHSDDDESLTEIEETSSGEDSAWEDEDEKEDTTEENEYEARINRAAELTMQSDYFLQELLEDFAMNLDEIHPPVVPSEGVTTELSKLEVKEMPPPAVAFPPTELSTPEPAPTVTVSAPLKKPAPVMKPLGCPLQAPGRLRNGFGMGIRAVCVHAVPKERFNNRGTVIKEIYMDRTERDQFETSERERYQKCLLQPISTELEHIVWPAMPDSTTSFPPATTCAITDHDELIAL